MTETVEYGDVYVTLPPLFVATKYPGYFWHLEHKRLYSLKVGGILRRLRQVFPNRFNHAPAGMGPYYELSHQGKRVFLSVRDLEQITPSQTEVPLQ